MMGYLRDFGQVCLFVWGTRLEVSTIIDFFHHLEPEQTFKILPEVDEVRNSYDQGEIVKNAWNLYVLPIQSKF